MAVLTPFPGCVDKGELTIKLYGKQSVFVYNQVRIICYESSSLDLTLRL